MRARSITKTVIAVLVLSLATASAADAAKTVKYGGLSEQEALSQKLIAEFGDLESVLAAAPAMKPSKRRDSLIEHADKARISKELVTLCADAPMPAVPARTSSARTAAGVRARPATAKEKHRNVSSR